jgi:hypothetical protein
MTMTMTLTMISTMTMAMAMTMAVALMIPQVGVLMVKAVLTTKPITIARALARMVLVGKLPGVCFQAMRMQTE